MFKKNLFHKKFTKLVLSITKGIESFFNLFKRKNFVKTIYLDPKKSTLDKKIFIPLATIFIAVIVYFVLPSFYNKNKVIAQIENQILQQYNFKVILDKNIKYGLFPKPHFLSENTRIVHDSKIIANSQNSRFFISKSNFFLFDKVKIQNSIFTKTDFEIDHSNFKFFFNLLSNNTSDQNIDFIKSKFFYLDKNDDVIFFTDVKKLNYIFQENFLNKIESKLEIFNLPLNLKTKNDILKKNIFTEIDFNSLKLKIKNNLDYKKKDLQGQLDLSLINNDKTVNYIIKNNNITFNTSNEKLKGEINIKPFFLFSNLNLYEIEVKKYFKDNSILLNLLKSEILNNKNLNGKIKFDVKNLKDLKHINAINFEIIFEEGMILITNLNFIFKNSVIFNLNDINLTLENNKLKFNGDLNLHFKDIKSFYSHFQIKKDHRKDIDKISSNFFFNLDDGFVEFDELRVSGVNKQILERYSNNFNSERKNILNKIIFRNAIKEFFKKISGD